MKTQVITFHAGHKDVFELYCSGSAILNVTDYAYA